MKLGSILDLSPLFLSLPTLLISLTLTNNLYNPNYEYSIDRLLNLTLKEKYSIPILQSFLLSALTLTVLAILINFGIIGKSFDYSVNKNEILQDGVIPTFKNQKFKSTTICLISLSIIFFTTSLLTPARLLNLLVISILCTSSFKNSRNSSQSSNANSNTLLKIWKNYQILIIFTVSFVYDNLVLYLKFLSFNNTSNNTFGDLETDSYDVVFTTAILKSLLGYSLLLIPILIFLDPLNWTYSNDNYDSQEKAKPSQRQIFYPNLKISLIYTFIFLTALLFFKFEEFNFKMLLVSVGSLVIIIFSQLEDINSSNSNDGNRAANNNESVSQFFPYYKFMNKAVFMENYKINMIVLNIVCFVIYQISSFDYIYQTFYNSSSNQLKGNENIDGSLKDSSNDLSILRFMDNLLLKNLPEILLNTFWIFTIKPIKEIITNNKRKVKFESSSNSRILPLLIQLFKSQETKSIFNFLLLNISFMFIQLLYSFRSKSLSLLSDSLHMLLDCMSLFLGLLASLISKNDLKSREFAQRKLNEKQREFNRGRRATSTTIDYSGIYSENSEKQGDKHGHNHNDHGHDHGHDHSHHDHHQEHSGHADIIDNDKPSDDSDIEPPSELFPFGLARIETLAGFTNASLLLGIVFGIYNEAVQRLLDPVNLKCTDELLIVSILGLFVNLVGIFAFNHGHDHGGHGHSHSHSHSHSSSHEHDHSEKHQHDLHSHSDVVITTQSDNPNNCNLTTDDSDSAEEQHLNDNMQGIFLHILADTLGSVGVVISTILIKITGYQILDPVMSIFIASLILVSSIPLLRSSTSNLLLELRTGNGGNQEQELHTLLNSIIDTPGVKSYTTPRFWPVNGTGNANDLNKLTGYLHIQFYRTENALTIKSKIDKRIKESKLFDKIYLQIENEIDDCWCRNGSTVFGSF